MEVIHAESEVWSKKKKISKNISVEWGKRLGDFGTFYG